jgi:hypothetical protein
MTDLDWFSVGAMGIVLVGAVVFTLILVLLMGDPE